MADNADDQYALKLLDPMSIRLFRSSADDSRVRLTLDGDRSWVSVAVAQAFPFSDPGRYIGLQSAAGVDIGVIEDLGAIDADSRRLVRQETERRYFTPTVERVALVVEQQGTVTFEVGTDRGDRRFIVRNIRDNAYPLGPTRLMITDTEGNRYHFADITKLGRKAYEVLAKVM
jgi:hypothetical protein